jgi:predicted O-methyltransferase YrrM
MHANVAAEALEWDYLNRRLTVTPKKTILELCVSLSRNVPGHIMEFGVAKGDSTRILRRALGHSQKRIYACDSFEGLREKFENAEVGTFACEPPRISGVEIVKGYFEDSLTPELAAKVGRVAFASLDADLYSSTLCALRWLTPLLGSGSLLLFDEFLGEKESEKRAFDDWSRETGLRTVRIAEFVREPSGWGTRIDKRPLFQVVGDDLLPKPAVPFRKRLRASPLGRIARSARDMVRDRK